MAMSPAPPPPDDVEASPLPPPPPSPLLIVTHSPLPPPPPSSPPMPPPPPSPFSPRSRSSPPPPGSISIDRQSPPPPPFPPMPPLPTFDGEDTTPEPGKGPLHRRTLSERDGDSSSFSSPLPPCPEDPPAPQSASCTPPKYQPQEENEEDTAKSEEDASSTQEVRSVEADDDDLSADADTEDMSIDIREERESALPTPPPPPSPPAATPMGGDTPPPPPPPPYSPPGRKPIPAAGNDASLKSAVADAQSRTGSVPSTMSSIASMRTAASNREIMATDVVRDPSPERPRWYIGEIENYTIIDKVGSGTYGEVFKCQHKITKDIVALKKMRSDVEKNGFPVTSIREMKILKQLKHPNVVTLKEIVSSNAPTKDGKRPPLYFAFEYLEHDLSGLLNHPRVKFSRTQIQCYMRQLLCGVAFMHRNKIVHRDIKASNLLLNNQGVLKVADFGLSRSWTEVNAKAGRYTNKVVTLWYRSPELLLGSTSYDFSVDVWSIGCIFGELLLGRPILQGKTEIDQLQMIFGLVGRPTEENWPDFKKLPGAKDVMFDDKYVCPLRERFKSFPPHAIDLLEKLLTLDPAKRITAAEAMDHDYFWRVVTCKPRDLPKFAVASTHEYQSKKRHHEEMAAQAAAAGDRHVRARGHRGEHHSHSRSHQGDKATGHPHGNHHSNRTDRGRPYRHREGEYFDRDRERDRSRERERGRSRDRDRPERPRDRSRERDDRHGHRPRHEEGNHHRRRGQDGGAPSLPA